MNEIDFQLKQQTLGHGYNPLIMHDGENKKVDGLIALPSEDDINECEQPAGYISDDNFQDLDDEMYINNLTQLRYM